MQPRAQKNGNYWRAHLRLLAVLLAIWFAVSYGAGILLADWLNQFSLGGFKLGFWMAQQGGIYAFIAIIFVYVWRVQKLEARHARQDGDPASHEHHPAQRGHSAAQQEDNPAPQNGGPAQRDGSRP